MSTVRKSFPRMCKVKDQTLSQSRVEAFMRMARQAVPRKPTEPSERTRLLRAALILEEALELIRDGLGIDLTVEVQEPTRGHQWQYLRFEDVCYVSERKFNMLETVDGCTDLAVVTTGTLSACGVSDAAVQEETDLNNLAKFGPGHHLREDGKLIKPRGHQPPDFLPILIAQGYEPQT